MQNNTSVCEYDTSSTAYFVVNGFSAFLCTVNILMEGIALLVSITYRQSQHENDLIPTFACIRATAEITYSMGVLSGSILRFASGLTSECTSISTTACTFLQLPLQTGFTVSVWCDLFICAASTYSVTFLWSWVTLWSSNIFTVAILMAQVLTILAFVGSVYANFGAKERGTLCLEIQNNSIEVIQQHILLAVVVLTLILGLTFIFVTQAQLLRASTSPHFSIYSRPNLILISTRLLYVTYGLPTLCRFVTRGLNLWFKFDDYRSSGSIPLILVSQLPVINSIFVFLIRGSSNSEIRARIRTALKLQCALKPVDLNRIKLQKDRVRMIFDSVYAQFADEYFSNLEDHGTMGVIKKRKAIEAFTEAWKAASSKTRIVTPHNGTSTPIMKVSATGSRQAPRNVEPGFMLFVNQNASNSHSETNETEMSTFDRPDSAGISGPSIQDAYNIPSSRIVFTDEELGSGAYGAVTVGYFETRNAKLKVAIKSPLDMDLSYRECLRRETKVMMYVEHHVNVLSLLGTVLNVGWLSAVLEYCAFGSLKTYLHWRRIYFRHFNERFGVSADNESSSSPTTSRMSDDYVGPGRHIIRDDEEIVTELDLLFYAFQIANGMEYLVTNKIIHRDVALRNMLLTDLHIVKISDFGLARRHEVSRGSGQHVPFKWYPPEAIVNEDYTGSDIWSFGVVLWELFTMGRDPYTHISTAAELVQILSAGYRLETPDYSPSEVYGLTLQCWHERQQDRPSFDVCKTRIWMIAQSISVEYWEGSMELLRVVSDELGCLQPRDERFDYNDYRTRYEKIKCGVKLRTEKLRKHFSNDAVSEEHVDPVGRHTCSVAPHLHSICSHPRSSVGSMNMKELVNSDGTTFIMKSMKRAPFEFKFDPVSAIWMHEQSKRLGLQCKSIRSKTESKVRRSTDTPPSPSARIVADGNCLFRTLSHTVTGSESYFSELRRLICNKIQSNPERYLEGKTYRDYLNQSAMDEDGKWGTDVELTAAADLLETRIYCYAPQPGEFIWIIFIPEKVTFDESVFVLNIGNHFEPVYSW